MLGCFYMAIPEIVTYSVIFLSVYVQIFLLLTFLERRKDIAFSRQEKEIVLSTYPTVTIVVPCWNEAKTVAGTIESLLALDYPKDKLSIFLVDDGSTDNTWEVMKQFEVHDHVSVFKKENGGKHTAVNFGIERATSEFIGCLDADSYAEPGSLKRIITYFVKDPKTMAVSPSIVVHRPKKIIEVAQRADYNMAAYIKKVYALVNGMHVAAGAFTIFRKKVFDTIGLYKNAYNTEDFEITLRMYAHHYKIEQCNDAFVYTVPPSSIKALFKQRLRWMFGFIKNVIDYRYMLFKKEYGTVAVFTLPAGIISIFAVIYLFFMLIIKVTKSIIVKIYTFKDTGVLFQWSGFHFDWFFINTQSIFFLIILLYALVVIAILIGKKMSGDKPRLSMDIVYFISIYTVLAPFWLMKAVYNAIFSIKTSWR
jgi:cellulose synthase/poly-beta-1,6-N-acetylglucosamine synthase-like glycosyltransferase